MQVRDGRLARVRKTSSVSAEPAGFPKSAKSRLP